MTAQEVLADACAAEKRIYLLFPSGLRITVYAQQVRAIQLVEALRAEQWIEQVSSVAIVGGGASGLTAAAAFKTAGLRDGLEVTIFESRDQVLPLQSGCHDKYLSPHLIDWPADSAGITKARLPILGWDQDIAARVASDIVDQFRRYGVIEKTQCQVKRVEELANGVLLTVEEGARTVERRFDLVVVAAGFGLESQPPGINAPTPPYWRVNPLQQPALDEPKLSRILISGLGDGGLIDFVLFACPGLTHADLCDSLANSTDADNLMPEIDRIEDMLWEDPSPVVDIARAYSELPIDQLARDLIVDHLRAGTEFSLLTQGRQLFHRGTAPLNRLAAMLVMRAMALADNGSHVREIVGASHLPDVDGKTVYSQEGVEHVESFDLVVIRHGDTSRAAWEFDNPKITAKVAELRSKREAITTRPATPELQEACLARVDVGNFGGMPTRVRLTRRGGNLTWQGDVAIEDIGRLWRVPHAKIHIQIDFAPANPPGNVEFAILRMLVHAEPQAQLSSPHFQTWVDLMNEIPVRAGDRTRPVVHWPGQVVARCNSYPAEADHLADKIESALDDGLLSMTGDRMAAIAGGALPPIDLHPSILRIVLDRWEAWLDVVSALTSEHRRWVFRLLGGFLNDFGQPDGWSAVRVGPKCLDDEIITGIIFHLAMQGLLEGFGSPAMQPTGNVDRRSELGAEMPAAHFCGSRWVRKDGQPIEIDEWDPYWPGEQWIPSCLVIPSRRTEFLPNTRMTHQTPAMGMIAQPWAWPPVIVGSVAMRRAMRAGENEARTYLMAALERSFPELDDE